jgi:hypothetical protein
MATRTRSFDKLVAAAATAAAAQLKATLAPAAASPAPERTHNRYQQVLYQPTAEQATAKADALFAAGELTQLGRDRAVAAYRLGLRSKRAAQALSKTAIKRALKGKAKQAK